MLLSNEINCYLKEEDVIFIGQDSGDIIINVGKFVVDNEKIINEENKYIYVNGNKTNEREYYFKYGDQILIDTNLFVFHSQYVEIIGDKNTYETNLVYYKNDVSEIEGFPDYKRAPRIIKKFKNDKITISKPPSKVERKKGSLAKVIIPPIVMGCGTVAMSLMMGRGLYMLIGLAGTSISLVFSVTAYFSDKKELKEKNEKRIKVYEEYLLAVRKKLNIFKQNEIEALHYNNPSLKEVEQMVNEYSSRVFERDINDDDFLTVCVGTANDKSEYQVSFDYDPLQMEKDELLDEAKEIYKEYQVIEDKPFLVDLKKAHLGIVGEKTEIHEQIKCILSQITFFQSYHDVQVILLYNDEFKNDFDYVKWYPHVKIHSVNLTGNIYNERIRDQVLGSLHQIFKDRKIKRDEGRKIILYTGNSANYNKEVVVPNLKGYSKEKAIELLKTLGIEAKTVGEGVVTGQSIEAGKKVDRGTSTIILNLQEMGD